MSSTSQPAQTYPLPKPQIKSLLGRHRILASSAGVRVSPLCLGAMNFGDAWKGFLGECSKETAWEMLDYFYDQGGNFIDTPQDWSGYWAGESYPSKERDIDGGKNGFQYLDFSPGCPDVVGTHMSVDGSDRASNYQAEQSEQWLGEWMEERGRRDEMVIATKYCGPWQMHDNGKHKMQSNFGGGASKNLHVCVEASLKKLRTSYIDLLYVHFWDMTTGVEELMQSLNHLVQSRQVLYLGISDTPAWFVVKANDYARHHGLRPFSVYQGKWSAAERDFERDIIPMCMDQGMALAPWGAVGGGYFKPKGKQDGEGRKMPSLAAKNAAVVSEVLERVAERKGTLITSVALAYVMHKSPYVFPIVGGRKVEHLKGNIEALGLKLTEADMEEIENAYPFDIGFPLNFLGGSARPEDNILNQRVGSFDYVKGPMPIEPADPGKEQTG